MSPREILREWAKAQKAASLPCPRCGGAVLSNPGKYIRNGVYICEDCFVQECQAEELDVKYPNANTKIALEDWFAVSKVYGHGKMKIDAHDKGMHFIALEESVMITDEQIKHIVKTALQGVSKMWCVAPVTSNGLAVYPEYASSVIVQNGSLHMMIDKPGDFCVAAPEPLTKENLLKGFTKWLEEGHDDGDVKVCVTNADAARTVNTDAIDSLVADEIIQFAVFGEIKHLF